MAEHRMLECETTASREGFVARPEVTDHAGADVAQDYAA